MVAAFSFKPLRFSNGFLPMKNPLPNCFDKGLLVLMALEVTALLG
jgi:hypothetical protein